MFPYPSGAGLHVGHPLGYIASDIVSRYKRLKGYNVLHPMGFDSFGLPAEQYAVQTGQHPAITTETNIARYKEQLGKLGFSFDWERESWTSKPDYYKWTQWIFIQIFHSWYNKATNKAEPISALISLFEKEGNANVKAACDEDTKFFSAEEWRSWGEKEQQELLLKYRLTYLAESMVNWCPGLGTVLANEEVVNGVSERGGYPVERKRMKQWIMRITAYSDRLLQGLDTIDWPEPMKDMQRNWIGKSFGAELSFQVVRSSEFVVPSLGTTTNNEQANKELTLTVFTTRVDTTFGVTYLSIAPESELLPQLTSTEQKEAVEAYVTAAKNRSERDRMTDVKTASGVFTGSYAINPFNGKQIPIWIADYVLAGYGTGVVMAVPSSDERDFRFATQYNLPIVAVQEGAHTDITKEDFDPKAGTMINSDFLNGLAVPEAIQKAIQYVEEKKIGKGKVMYRQRDAIFARQRYWGEPIPVYYKDGLPYTMDDADLPLELPKIDEYKPTETGEPPLGRAKDFNYTPRKPHPTLPSVDGEGFKAKDISVSNALNSPVTKVSPHGGNLEGAVSTNNSEDLGGANPLYQTADTANWKYLKEMGRENRKNPTPAEDELWQSLRSDKLGFNFRRQHSIGNFIADFVCLTSKLIVEADGGIHELPENKEYDEMRTRELTEMGFQVIRFSNDEILDKHEEVLVQIKDTLVAPPNPPRGEGFKAINISSNNAFNSPFTQVLPHGEDLGGATSYPLELSTMPGWAGSSWYFLRYMDAKNENRFASTEAEKYWNQVDLYMGGAEHATGHLLYSRFWNMFLYDLGLVTSPEPFKKLINQGMIQGRSNFVYRITDSNKFVSANLKKDYDCSPIHVDVNIVENDILDIEAFKKWRPDLADAEFILEDGKYICGWEVEKMSKSKYNVVNPDDIVDKYGADTLRLYEMFLGPLEQFKPWNTSGIDGSFRFLRKLWNLFHDKAGNFSVSDAEPTKEEYKVLHTAIKKIEEDIERFSFNTSVSNFMVCVNKLQELGCNKRLVLQDLLVIISPYAPHIAEELWSLLGNLESITKATFPIFNPQHLFEDAFEYPISINGKVRSKMTFPMETSPADIEKEVLASEEVMKWTDGNPPKKVIVVPKRIVNVVI